MIMTMLMTTGDLSSMFNGINIINRQKTPNCGILMKYKQQDSVARPPCHFSMALFWDVNQDSLDIEAHSRFIIARVVTRGNLDDWHLLKKIYGKRKIKSEVAYIRCLDQKSISFLCAYFSKEKTDFRCCR